MPFVVVGMARRRDRAAEPPLRPDDPVAHIGPPLALGVIILVAGFVFRSAELDRLPWGYAGIIYDGAYNSDVAFRILDGGQPFTPIVPSAAYMRDAMIHYYLAAFYASRGVPIDRGQYVLFLVCSAVPSATLVLARPRTQRDERGAVLLALTLATLMIAPLFAPIL